MWAYPRWYRRERGLELLTTLLDDAAPGQRRPTRAAVVDLLRGGLGLRLRPPRGFGSQVLSTVVALYVGLAGAAIAVRLVGLPGPPSEDAAIAAATAAVGQQPHNVAGPPVACDLYDCPGWDGHDDVVAIQAPVDRTDRTVVSFHLPPAEQPFVAAQARERLIAAGWHAKPVWIVDDGQQQLEASKDGINLLLTTIIGASDSPPVTVVVSKGFSASTLAALFTGLLGGLLAGRAIAVSAVRRYRRHRLGRRALIAVTAAPFLFVAPASVSFTALLAVFDAAQNLSPKIMKVPLLVLPGSWPVTIVAVLSALTALAIAAAPGPVRTATESTRLRGFLIVTPFVVLLAIHLVFIRPRVPEWLSIGLTASIAVTVVALAIRIRHSGTRPESSRSQL